LQLVVFKGRDSTIIDISEFLDGEDFLDNDRLSVANVQHGRHYKITLIKIGACGTDKEMAHMKKHKKDDGTSNDNST
jgi:hypothetical protein